MAIRVRARTVAGALSCALAVAAVGGGCNKPQKLVLTKEQQRTIDESILKEAPKPQVPINANLGDKVRLLGVDIPKTLTPGKPATITWYWEATGDLTDDWMIFVHLERPGQKRQILDHQPVDGLYPLGQWKKGQIVKDVQNFTVDSGFTNGEAVLWVGVFNKVAWETKQANDRLKLVNAGEVKNDGDNRIEAARTTVVGGAATPAQAAAASRPPTYVVKRADAPITVDGKLDEAAWAQAPRTRTFLRPDGRPLGPDLATFARMLYDDQNLYVAFDVKDSDIVSDRASRDDKVWEQDAVEVYLDPGSDGKRYLELQVSPKNVVFDALFDSHRTPPWEEAAKRTTLPMQTAVAVDGSVNEPGPDKSWTVEMAIPFSAIPDAGSAPAPGATWTANLYRIDQKGATNMAFQGVWAPVGGDFHKLDGAGTINFAPPMPKAPTPGEAAAPPTTPAGAPANPPASGSAGEAPKAPEAPAPAPEAPKTPEAPAPGPEAPKAPSPPAPTP